LSVESLIKESAQIAVQIAWPRLQPIVGGELLADEAHLMLDRDTGIDLMWLHQRNRYPVSVRFQRVTRGNEWQSFTLRESDVKKLTRAVGIRDALRPAYMIQTYLDRRDDSFLSTGMCRVDRLVELVPTAGAYRHNPQDGTPFKAVFWEDFMGRGIVAVTA
jgi:hypothetical protein